LEFQRNPSTRLSEHRLERSAPRINTVDRDDGVQRLNPGSRRR